MWHGHKWGSYVELIIFTHHLKTQFPLMKDKISQKEGSKSSRSSTSSPQSHFNILWGFRFNFKVPHLVCKPKCFYYIVRLTNLLNLGWLSVNINGRYLTADRVATALVPLCTLNPRIRWLMPRRDWKGAIMPLMLLLKTFYNRTHPP